MDCKRSRVLTSQVVRNATFCTKKSIVQSIESKILADLLFIDFNFLAVILSRDFSILGSSSSEELEIDFSSEVFFLCVVISERLKGFIIRNVIIGLDEKNTSPFLTSYYGWQSL